MNSTSFTRSVAMAALVAVLTTNVRAADFLGAAGVLSQVAERNAKPGEKPAADANAKFLEELKSFSRATTNLAPADAAKRWLELADRAVKISGTRGENFRPGMTPVNAESVLAALPPPSAWGELAKAVAARPPAKGAGELRAAGLRFLAATLNGDQLALNREINALAAKSKDANAASTYLYRNYLEQISRALLEQSDNPDTILQSLERELNAAQAGGRNDLTVPNLVAQVGAAKAEAFLRKALVAPGAALNFDRPNETSRLAQKLALELLDQLKSPQWGLVNSLGAVELYEALDKKFPAPKAAAPVFAGLTNLPPDVGNDLESGDDKRKGAEMYYLLGLIANDRAKDAAVLAKKMGGTRNDSYLFESAFDSASKAMRQAGHAAALDNFFNELLTQDPTLPFWDQYVQTAADAGQTERMLATVRKVSANADLSQNTKAELQQILFKALLAADKVDEAVKELRGMTAADEAETENASFSAGKRGALLARFGVLLQKPEWTEEGIGMAKKWLAEVATKNRREADSGDAVFTLATILTDLQRGPEAEALLADTLAFTTAEGNQSRGYSWRGSPAAQTLRLLALLYHQAGRPADVVQLLENSPDWGVRDVSGLFDNFNEENLVTLMWQHTGSSALPLPFIAAKTLLASGQKDAAQKITDALLDRSPGSDRGYELLLELQGTNAIPKLDELFTRDQFEERPLIWKAHLLRTQNQLEAAEKILRQAVSIDPSDGEEGRGDRMRVYAELAEVRAARGDAKEADFFREVVKSIRLSEDADQFYSVGLLKRAVAMYEEGLKHFADAYCIQSRLAIQLSALGLTDEAEEHYRRAFELMPDSFGRVESHCFGCERAFDGERAQSIAEKTFTKLAAERPDKPQIHYLLGYLRTEQERFNEARTNFLTAVRLDPDYLNAWLKLQEAGAQTLLPAKERDDITFNLLRLDPLHRHTTGNFSRVSDLPRLWHAVAAAATHQTPASTNLFTLTASKAALEKKAKERGGPESRFGEFYDPSSAYMRRAEEMSPAAAVAETPFVRLAGEMLFSVENSMSW